MTSFTVVAWQRKKWGTAQEYLCWLCPCEHGRKENLSVHRSS